MSDSSTWHQRAAKLVRTLQTRIRTGYYNERAETLLLEAMSKLEGDDPVMEKFADWSEAVLAALESEDEFVIELRQFKTEWEAYLAQAGARAFAGESW